MDGELLDVGGYNDAIFLNLSKREKREYTCNICQFILNTPHQCSNGHLYCLSCITEWTKRGNKTCPVCTLVAAFKENRLLRDKIDSKYVRCEASLCTWKGRLERLWHHVNQAHHSSAESSESYDKDNLTEDDRIEFHKSTKEVTRLHNWKKEVLLRRIKKMEKNKRNVFTERESAQTLPIDYPSRSDNYRPFTDGTERKKERFPRITWQQSPVNRDTIYKRLNDIENTKRVRREMANKKIEQIERRKQLERDNLYKKIHELERKREENRHVSEQRIQEIEQRMKEEKEAFQKRISEKERKNKEGFNSLHRRISVIKVKMKR